MKDTQQGSEKFYGDCSKYQQFTGEEKNRCQKWLFSSPRNEVSEEKKLKPIN